MRHGELDVRASLRRAGAPYVLTPSQLASSLLLSRGGMTARLNRLEQAQLIARDLDPANRSSFKVSLTTLRFEVVDSAITAHAANLTRLVSGLDPLERSTLDRLVGQLLRQLTR